MGGSFVRGLQGRCIEAVAPGGCQPGNRVLSLGIAQVLPQTRTANNRAGQKKRPTPGEGIGRSSADCACTGREPVRQTMSSGRRGGTTEKSDIACYGATDSVLSGVFKRPAEKITNFLLIVSLGLLRSTKGLIRNCGQFFRMPGLTILNSAASMSSVVFKPVISTRVSRP